MKTKQGSAVDEIFYSLVVILSFGTVWITRIIITRAVRMAFENKD